MAPKKSGFMVFMFEWKAKNGPKLSLVEATNRAGEVWKNMSMQERGPYNERAKNTEIKDGKKREKLNCYGVPFSFVDRELASAQEKEANMKRATENVVNAGVKANGLENIKFHFIMCTYFTKSTQGNVYIPAELAMCEYSLKDGLSRVYHTLINPGVSVFGQLHDAQTHSKETHALPLPPKALGESDISSIYEKVVEFLRKGKSERDPLPPMYTCKAWIPIVESCLSFLSTELEDCDDQLKVHDVEYLFYLAKDACCKIADLPRPKSKFITNSFFERDFFEYQSGISCEFHEEIDRTKYCCKSYVIRWAYMFSDYMCRDLALEIIPGRHVPIKTNVALIVDPPALLNRTNTTTSGSHYATVSDISSIARKENISNTVSAVASGGGAISKIQSGRTVAAAPVFDKSYMAETSTFTNLDSSEFPSLKTSRKSKAHTLQMECERDMGSDLDNSNPWESRSQYLPPHPVLNDFHIDFSRQDLLNQSTSSYSRGRGISTLSLNSSTTTARGSAAGGNNSTRMGFGRGIMK